MSEPFAVEECGIFFLVEESARIFPTVTFLQRRGLEVETHSDIKEFLLSCTEKQPEFLAISVNHHNPKVFELIEVLGQQLSCDVIIFAEMPDRRSLPLIRRAKRAHKLFGSMSGPSILLKMRKILRKKLDPSMGPSKLALETIEGRSNQASQENFLVTEGKVHNDQTFTSDVRRRGEGPSIFKGKSHEKGPLIWQEGGGRGPGPAQVADAKPPVQPPSKSQPLEIEVFDERYKKVAQWIEDSLRNTVQNQTNETLPFPKETKKLAVVQVKNDSENGYLVLACSREEELKANFLDDLHKNLKEFKALPSGPQWDSFRLIDVDISDVQNWLRDLTQARVLSPHQSTQLMASFLSSEAILPKLKESFKGHYAISISDLKPETPIDYDTFLRLELNDKLIQYVARGGHFSQKQLDRLALMSGNPLVIKKEDLEIFEAQFLRENILQLGAKPQKKKAA